MYVRVTPYSFDPARLDETMQFTEERLIPALRQLPGFRRYVGSGDRATGRGVVLTERDEQEHAQNLRTALSGVLIQNIADLGMRLGGPTDFRSAGPGIVARRVLTTPPRPNLIASLGSGGRLSPEAERAPERLDCRPQRPTITPEVGVGLP